MLGLLKDSNVDLVEDEDGFYVEAASGNTGWGGSPHGQEEPFEELQGTGPYEQQDVVAEHFVGVADNHGASEAMTQEACEDSLGSLGLGGTPADALMPQESQASPYTQQDVVAEHFTPKNHGASEAMTQDTIAHLPRVMMYSLHTMPHLIWLGVQLTEVGHLGLRFC